MLFRPVPTDPDHQPDQQAEDDQLYRDILHELIHIGTDLARLVHQQAVAHAQAAAQGRAPSDPASPTTAFDRTARAIRRCITLARSLSEPAAPVRDHKARPRAAARAPILSEAGDAAPARAHAVAVSERDDSADAKAPSAGRRDRPEAPDRDKDDLSNIGACPPAAVIAAICRDLGLDAPPSAHPWPRPIPADTGQFGARAAAPSGAASSSACQPGAGPQTGPQRPGHGTTQRSPDPHPNGHDSDQPAASPRAQPGPTHPGSSTPHDPAPAIATVLRHPTQIQERWRPSPTG